MHVTKLNLEAVLIKFRSLDPDNPNGICIVEKGDGSDYKIGDIREFSSAEGRWEVFSIEPVK